MAKFDYSALSPVEFEEMCGTILGQKNHCSFERFGEGPDDGIDLRNVKVLDGRLFLTIFQCKRYKDASSLLSALRKERVKVEKLKPERYGIVTSASLSPRNKKKILELFAGYIKTPADIIGREQLDDLLDSPDYSWVVDKTIGLWLPSTQSIWRILYNRTIGRSLYESLKFKEDVKGCYWTQSIGNALDKLFKYKVVVITGNPGVGKTTAAKNIATLLQCRYKYKLCVTYSLLKELEDVWNDKAKQVFYYDDFLGTNYFEAITENKDSEICNFIRRVRDSSNKYLILTSRTTILARADVSSVAFYRSQLLRAPYICNMDELSQYEKARILYAEMQRSKCPAEILKSVLSNRNYMKIINHRNFNPRLVEYIFSKSNVDQSLTADAFFKRVVHSLDHPSEVWQTVFQNQLSNLETLLVWCVFLHPEPTDDAIKRAYARLVLMKELNHAKSVLNCNEALRPLLSSVFTRCIVTKDKTLIRLFNPSIGDYLICIFGDSAVGLRLALCALRSVDAINKFVEVAETLKLSFEFQADILYYLADNMPANQPCEIAALLLTFYRLLTYDKKRFASIVTRRMHQIITENTLDSLDATSLAGTLCALDDVDVPVKHEYPFLFERTILLKIFSKCRDFYVASRLLKLAEKCGVDVREDVSDDITELMIDLAYESLLRGLCEPSVEIVGYLEWEIPHEEIKRLGADLRECIDEIIEEEDIGSGVVDVDRVVDNIDFHEYFRPSDEDFERYREYDYEPDDYRFHPNNKSADASSRIDSLFKGFCVD